jgi:hypothetical protein
MKHTIQYIIYSIGIPKKHTGLLGNLDTYVLYLLLLGGKDGIEENIETKEPIEFYTNILKEQDMVIKSTFYEKLKGIERVWIEIDSEKTNINEYKNWRETTDPETLAWKPFIIPCIEGTKNEALGLSVMAKETYIFKNKHKVSVYDIISSVLV